MHRAVVDDAPAPAAVAQMTGEGLGEEEGAAQVDAQDVVEILFVGVEKGSVLLDAGVVHQDIEAAHLLDGLRHQPPTIGHRADIGGDETGAPAQRAHLRQGLSRRSALLAAIEHDSGTLFGQPPRDPEAYAMGAAGHQGDLVAQFHVSPREPYRLSQIFDDSIPGTFISRGEGLSTLRSGTATTADKPPGAAQNVAPPHPPCLRAIMATADLRNGYLLGLTTCCI